MKIAQDPAWFRSIGRWLRGDHVRARGYQNKPRPAYRPLDFRKLERRRVYAVDAFFLGGSLNIELSGSTHNTANLLSDGKNFFVDTNNNFCFDPADPHDPLAQGEVYGLVSDLESLTVVGKDNQGFFFWGGDFSNAPLCSTQQVNAVTIEDVEHVTVQANFHTKGDVSIEAHYSITFDSSFQVDGDLKASVGRWGAITDCENACVRVHGDLVLHGGDKIELADNTSNFWRIDGHTDINSSGCVQLGTSGHWDSNTLSVVAKELTVREFDDLNLGNLCVSEDVSITTGGSISDMSNSEIFVGGDFSLQGKDISLANDMGDTLQVARLSSFHATDGNVDIGDEGYVELGDIFASGNNITIYEDCETSLAAIDASGNLLIHSSASITDVPGTKINVDGNSLFCGATIFLADNLHDAINIRGEVSLIATGGSVTIACAGTVVLEEVSAEGSSIKIYEDDDTILKRIETPGAFFVSSAGAITDTVGAKILAAQVELNAADSISIANDISDRIQATGSGIFISNGKDISVGPLGDARFSEIGFSTVNLLDGSRGNVTIQLDQSTTLINPILTCSDGRTLSNSAKNVSLDITGGLDSRPGVIMTVVEDLNIKATESISIFNSANDSLTVSGQTRIQSVVANITVGSAGYSHLGVVTLVANQGDINVGGIGKTYLGTISAYANNIAILEDDSILVRAAFADKNLVLISSSNILSTEAYNASDLTGISADRAFITAGTSAHLGLTNILKLNISVGANEELLGSSLFVKNAVADATGQLYLNTIGTNLPAGVLAAGQTLSGETLEELRARASFEDSFGNSYGLYIRNNTSLTVETAYNVGDGIRSYVETVAGQDIVIAGQYLQKFTGRDTGGIVLIAGDQLEFTPKGRLVIESISSDPSTNRTILQPLLVANAFDGGTGPTSFESTRDVLYASDAISDTGTQNVLQRLSTQFGVAGESGFQTLIQYADGNSQRFGNRQDLFASLLNSSTAPAGTGVLLAHSSESGDAAVFERNVPFANTFLGTYQTLPTTAIFRRSEEFFMFSNGGRTDNAILKVDLTSAVDEVGEVYAPGRKVSFSLPNLIVVSPSVGVPTQLVSVNADVVYTDTNNELEPRVVSDATTEISIIRVGFEDTNDDGQVSDNELPDRSEIQIIAIKNNESEENLENLEDDRQESSENSKGPFKKRLLHGELDLATKDIKGTSAASTVDIERWIAEYRNDFSKPSGAYAVISVDSMTGVKVLEVFGTRDFESSDTKSNQDNPGYLRGEGVPINPVPAIPTNESPNTQQQGERISPTSRDTSYLPSPPLPASFSKDSLEPALDNLQPFHGALAVGALVMAGIRRSNIDSSIAMKSPTSSQSSSRFSTLARRLRLVQKELNHEKLS